MRYLLALSVLALALQVKAHDTWHGFCIVERDGARICSAYYPRSSDYASICNAFAHEERVGYWSAQFFSSLDFLRLSLPDYCDQVRDGSGSGFYACQTESYCPADSMPVKKHLASKVYALNDEKSLSACFQKEERRYELELKKQSLNGCFLRIVTERLESLNI
jgi:hypothetical protein